MKKIIKLLLCLAPTLVLAQQDQENPSTFNQFLNNLSGSFESNAQWYLNDKKTGEFEEEDQLRANSYLRLDYQFLKHFKVGIQAESYLPTHLLNYDRLYDKEFSLTNYYAQFSNEKLDITAGYFYEQFGSGLILRSWEDRALGVNNAIRGGKIEYSPTKFIQLTALYGQQRRGLDISDSKILGFDGTFGFNKLFKIDSIDLLDLGLSFVNRREDYSSISENPIDIPKNVYAYSARLDFNFKNLYSNFEYIYKSKDLRLNNTIPNIVSYSENKLFDGNALLLNLGYSKKGLGINYTFRRLENMSFYSQREDLNRVKNPTNRATINYLPALTKQHDYTLANIYLYQSQPGLFVENYETPRVKAGEIGNQIDIYYKFKKGTTIGGKYGTNIAFNLSYWAALNTNVSDPNGIPYFSSDDLTYETDFLNFKNKLFTDFNFEIRKKWSKKLSSIFTYINLFYNSDYLVEANGNTIDAWIGIAESTYKLGKGKSIRLEGQHLSTNDDVGNWYGGTIEYFHNSNFGIYFNDSYNYEDIAQANSFNEENNKIHFFNVGGSYTKGATRVALNYGRQRGGLLCVGGVCRPVNKNTGVTLNLTTSF